MGGLLLESAEKFEVGEQLGAKGVVVTCGTQALTELAYFADLVWSFPQPLIFTASIFNAGVPGSETALHFAQFVQAALSETCWGQRAWLCLLPSWI